MTNTTSPARQYNIFRSKLSLFLPLELRLLFLPLLVRFDG